MKTLFGAIALCALCASGAQAEIADRVVPADVPPQVLYQNIVVAAASMCQEAANAGEVFDVPKCVDVVVEETVREINRPSLTLFAQTTTPAEITRRNG
jgi:hypothetical protein